MGRNVQHSFDAGHAVFMVLVTCFSSSSPPRDCATRPDHRKSAAGSPFTASLVTLPAAESPEDEWKDDGRSGFRIDQAG